MSDAPINRKAQIRFMTEAGERCAERHKRWSNSKQLKAMLREPAPMQSPDCTDLKNRGLLKEFNQWMKDKEE